jgi:hypothetical protein
MTKCTLYNNMQSFEALLHSLACADQLLEQHANALLLNVQDAGQLLEQELRIKLACRTAGKFNAGSSPPRQR